MALRWLLVWREHRKVKFASDVFDSAHRAILSIMRPGVYAEVVEGEKQVEENSATYDFDDFMRIVESVKSEE